jgi:hypothetical protein
MGRRRTARERSEEHLARRDVRVLVEEVVLRKPDVLEAGLLGFQTQLEVLHEDGMLGVTVLPPPRLGNVALRQEPEFHLRLLFRGATAPLRMSLQDDAIRNLRT